MNRKERMKKVFAYLRDQGYIHTQKDLANAIGSTPPNISKMLKGDPLVLTDSICVRIQKTFKMISADWLISGEGEMVVANSNKITTEQLQVPDYSSLINATISAKDETIASLKRELEAKDALIKLLKQQVSDLDFALSAFTGKSTTDYPFPCGIAEDSNRRANKKNI